MDPALLRPVWLVVAVLLLLAVSDTRGSIWRKSLEKEVLHTTIKYLREQLIVCLKTTDGLRGKRKAELDASYWLAELELQLDLDILENSRDYLMDRVVHCRRRLDHTKPPVVEPLGLDSVLMSKFDKYITSDKLLKAPRNMIVLPQQAPTARAAWQHPETTTTTAPVSKVELVLDDRRMTCGELVIRRGTFQCLDLRVDDYQRLPNKDFCPPTYEANRWRSAEDMPTRTRDVVDVINLCAVIGQELHVPGYSKGASVVWDCTDHVTPRLKWQNSKWAGRVEDNGFLHDLQCVYSADVTWPLT